MPQNQSTPAHCPGFQELKHLSSFICTCPECGEEVEIFSDEFDSPHNCPGCGKPIDFTRCAINASADDPTPR